jgi:hypothetical protein
MAENIGFRIFGQTRRRFVNVMPFCNTVFQSFPFERVYAPYYCRINTMPTDLATFEDIPFENAVTVASPIEAWKLGLLNLGMADAAAEAVLENGVISLNEFMSLTDEEVTLLIKSIRKPGGADKGQPLPIVIERRLKGFWWFCHFKLMTARDPTVSDMTVTNADSWAKKSVLMKDPKDATGDGIDLSKYQENWPKVFEHLDDWIGQHYGTSTKAPLLYLCRKQENPPAEDQDPSTNYKSLREELIARCPMWIDYDAMEPFLRPAYYEVENMKLWETLHKVFQSTPSYQYMKLYAKAKDGRGAYLALKSQYLGPNNANNMAQATTTKLDQLRYTGENRRWNMQRYVTAHVECFNILDGLKEYGFSGMDEATRVRKFVAGIKTDKLDAIRAAVLANPTLSFDRVTRLYRDHVAMTQSMNPSPQEQRQVSDVRTSSNRDDVEDRYYTRDEYNKLTADQKFSLKKKRERRGGGRKDGNSDRKSKPAKKTQFHKHPVMKAAMKAARRQIAAMSLSDKEEPEESESEGQKDAPVTVKQNGGNRDHPALEKKRRKGGRE